MDGYGDLIAARLRKLAGARSTGLLPFAGQNREFIYFRDGEVTGARSRRTPASTGTLGPAPTALARLAALLSAVEPVLDAALELLSGQSRYGKFQACDVPGGPGVAVDDLLAEVARRQHVLRQLDGIVSADTTVVQNPRLGPQRVRVSAVQWSLLIRVGDGSTPRDLAWDLNRSVFGTTIEVYRLLALRLLSTPAGGAGPADGAGATGGAGPAGGNSLSFIRAVPAGVSQADR